MEIKEAATVVVTEMEAVTANQVNQVSPDNQESQVNQEQVTVMAMEMEAAMVNQANQEHQVTEMAKATEREPATVQVPGMDQVMAPVTAMVPVMAMVTAMVPVMAVVAGLAPDQDQVVLISASQTGHLNGNSIICSVSLTLWPPLIATVKFMQAHLALINSTDTVAHAET